MPGERIDHMCAVISSAHSVAIPFLSNSPGEQMRNSCKLKKDPFLHNMLSSFYASVKPRYAMFIQRHALYSADYAENDAFAAQAMAGESLSRQ